MGLRVAVAGAGLGGLCLAQGLHRAGAEVTVYERDTALAGRQQGYRLHLKLVPPPLLDGFTAIVGGQAGMAAGLVQFRQRPEQAPAAIAPLVRLSPAGDYLMWAVTAHRGHFLVPDARLGELDPAGLHEIAARMIRPGTRTCAGCSDLLTSTRHSWCESARRYLRRPGSPAA